MSVHQISACYLLCYSIYKIVPLPTISLSLPLSLKYTLDINKTIKKDSAWHATVNPQSPPS